MTYSDQEFDARMRQSYRAAIDNTSPALSAQLHQRRHKALQRSTSKPMWQRLLFPAFASTFAIVAVMGVYMMTSTPQQSVGAPLVNNAQVIDAELAEEQSILDESPDFYVWLGSLDSNPVAME